MPARQLAHRGDLRRREPDVTELLVQTVGPEHADRGEPGTRGLAAGLEQAVEHHREVQTLRDLRDHAHELVGDHGCRV